MGPTCNRATPIICYTLLIEAWQTLKIHEQPATWGLHSGFYHMSVVSKSTASTPALKLEVLWILQGEIYAMYVQNILDTFTNNI